LERQRENHIGETITDEEGRLAYLKTFRLSEAQCRRGHLLSKPAENGWNMRGTAAALHTDWRLLGCGWSGPDSGTCCGRTSWTPAGRPHVTERTPPRSGGRADRTPEDNRPSDQRVASGPHVMVGPLKARCKRPGLLLVMQARTNSARSRAVHQRATFS
jgi:hypothetical protein